MERLRGNRALSTALTGITAAVVGVIANLAVYFALHTLFADTSRITSGPFNFEYPHLDSIQWAAVAITALGCALIFWRGWSMLRARPAGGLQPRTRRLNGTTLGCERRHPFFRAIDAALHALQLRSPAQDAHQGRRRLPHHPGHGRWRC